MSKSSSRRIAATRVLALPLLVAAALAVPSARAQTRAAAVTVYGGSVTTTESPTQPFAGSVYVSLPAGSSGGSNNGSFTGSQTLAIPAGKRLIVQSMSMYRGGSVAANSNLQVFVNAYTNGNIHAWAMPTQVANGTTYPGASTALTFYVDGGTNLLVNAFRNVSTGFEAVFFDISGYLVDVVTPATAAGTP